MFDLDWGNFPLSYALNGEGQLHTPHDHEVVKPIVINIHEAGEFTKDQSLPFVDDVNVRLPCVARWGVMTVFLVKGEVWIVAGNPKPLRAFSHVSHKGKKIRYPFLLHVDASFIEHSNICPPRGGHAVTHRVTVLSHPFAGEIAL
ncbi:hypothetical protein CN151_10590 [Sinorhizobium meliloti]|uniref:hypothetical protein n=1 Tax=Rhizobium meliloti TaxID=382 RepID=UPI000FD4EFA9|nr:hypothetical protein [Sinorhizobium meliloti]RVL05085.1 hypothetical protein CN151_10590 [Sinorhizobium meliloti]